jgi:hypothetical protein
MSLFRIKILFGFLEKKKKKEKKNFLGKIHISLSNDYLINNIFLNF